MFRVGRLLAKQHKKNINPGLIPGMVVDINPDLMLQTDGSLISSLTESSGNNYTFSMVSSTHQPTLKWSIVNGKKALRFSGNQWLLADTYAPDVASPITIYAVAQNDTIQDGTIASSVTGSNGTTVRYESNGGNWLRGYRNGFNTLDTPLGILAGIFSVTTLVSTATSTASGDTSTYTGTTLLGTVTSFGSSSNNANLSIGALTNPAAALTGYIARVIIYSSAHSTSQLLQMQNYLKTTYGL